MQAVPRESEKEMNRVSLIEMKRGQTGKVVEIAGGRGFLEKLQNMGLRPGTKITKVSQQFMKGPVVVKAGSTQMGMGFGMASKVMVEVD